MALKFYDDGLVLYATADVLKTTHNGHLGGSEEKLVYLRNNDVSKYYTNIVASVVVSNYDDMGQFGSTGWGIKLLYGNRQPTEAEWDTVLPNGLLELPDIGSTLLADTFTYHPIWVRVYCPGNTSAQRRLNQTIRISSFERNVGG